MINLSALEHNRLSMKPIDYLCGLDKRHGSDIKTILIESCMILEINGPVSIVFPKC